MIRIIVLWLGTLMQFDRAKKIYEYAEPNLTIVALMGIIGFPAYYFVWTWLAPESYENLGFRIVCGLLLVPILLRDVLPIYLKRYLHIYYVISLGVCIPYFFFYMLLKNDWSMIWSMSLMSGIFLQILLIYDTRIVFLQSLTGYAAAYATIFVQGDPVTYFEWTLMPVFFFTYAFGTLFYYRNFTENESKVSLAKSFGAGIAHEMRNPLSAVYSSIEVVKHLLPERNAQQLSDFYPLDAKSLDEINGILDDSLNVIERGNETISLLLTSIDEHKLSTSSFRRHSLGETLESSIEGFHFNNAADRSLIRLTFDESEPYFGSDVLLRYVIFNLLKNALYYKHRTDFQIDIKLVIGEEFNSIFVEDTGPGIDSENIENIFSDFYTSGKKGGFGLGLPFCRKVMKAFKGTIVCKSEVNKGTQFELRFPKYESERVFSLKSSVVKDKSLLYLGGAGETLNALQSHAFFTGYELSHSEPTSLDLNAGKLIQDVILVNLSSYQEDKTRFISLEKELCSFEGKIVYLYSGNILNYLTLNRILSYELLEVTAFTKGLATKLDKLFFEKASKGSEITRVPEGYKGNTTILIVDDNASLRLYSSTLLERQGYKVLQAENGREALLLLNSNDVNLILMDLEMPEMDGIETTVAIRDQKYQHNGKDIPIICFTGEKCEKTLKSISESGMNDYILKPASKDVLIQKVSTWI
ncbi:hybrid sensor histidine kinase/response regulator [Vibrio sp. vnigr-6D03]|nr:hybrid sensor histidine kinase/response regulator [Vibrio sp. vnigr-6D03]